MNNLKKIIPLIIILGVMVGLYLVLSNIVLTDKKNNNSNTINQPENEKITTNYGFSFIIPNGWFLEGKSDNDINIVEFGSTAQNFTFVPQSEKDEIFRPAITISSFIIDERLSAKEVTNLKYDEKIVDKITVGTDKCYSDGEEITVAGMNAYSYVYDVTNFEICNIATESSISKNIVVKNTGDQNTIMLTLVTRDRNELNNLLPDFQKVLDSVKYQ